MESGSGRANLLVSRYIIPRLWITKPLGGSLALPFGAQVFGPAKDCHFSPVFPHLGPLPEEEGVGDWFMERIMS